jgi:hypothetical protein
MNFNLKVGGLTAMDKTPRWLRSIEKVTCYDSKAGLTFSIARNRAATSVRDEFIYRCTTDDRKLMFDMKIGMTVAIAAVSSWSGDIEVQQRAPVGSRL